MKSRRLAGGYIDRDHLDKAIRANCEMTALMLAISTANIPPVLAVSLMKFAALLNEQSGHLHQMQSIRGEAAQAPK